VSEIPVRGFERLIWPLAASGSIARFAAASPSLPETKVSRTWADGSLLRQSLVSPLTNPPFHVKMGEELPLSCFPLITPPRGMMAPQKFAPHLLFGQRAMDQDDNCLGTPDLPHADPSTLDSPAVVRHNTTAASGLVHDGCCVMQCETNRPREVMNLTRCLGLFGMLVVSLGCGQVANENEEPVLSAVTPSLQASGAPPQPEEDFTALETYLDGSDEILPATYEVQNVFVSHLVSKFHDGSFNFDLASASDSRFATESILLSTKVGGSYEERFAKENELWQSHGFLKCKARVERNERPRAVFAGDGRPAVQISVNVILTDVTDAVPSLTSSPFTRTLGYLMRAAHTEEKPLQYTATIVVAQEAGRFVVASHGSEGQELTPEALQAIVLRNVMTTLSLELVSVTKKAAGMVLFPKGERITLETLQGFDRHRKQAEEMRVAKQARDSLQSATKSLVDAIPAHANGVKIHVAFTPEVRDQLRHNALDVELFDAVAHLWELRAAAVRSRPGYSAKQLAEEAAAIVQEFGVITVICDLEIGRPLIRADANCVLFPVKYLVTSVDQARPRATASWIVAATWAALPRQGEVRLEFPVEARDKSELRIGHQLPVGGLLDRGAPALAWGAPADILSPQSVLNAATRAVAEAIAVGCHQTAQEAIDMSPADRIQRRSSLFGGIECLPEASPQEDGVDLAVLAKIAEEVLSGTFWEKRLPGVAEVDQEAVASLVKKLLAVLKPRKWTSKINERIMASPVFLSDTHVMFDLGEGQQRLGVARDVINENGSRLLDRIQQIAVECVGAINDAARSRDGVQPEQAEAAWQAASEATRSVVSGNRAESEEGVSNLAAVFGSLASDFVTESVRSNVARCAAAVFELTPSRGDDNKKLLQAFLAHQSDGHSIQSGVVAYAEMLLATGDKKQCRELVERAVDCHPKPNQLCDYGRVAWMLGSVLMADGNSSESLEWLQKAYDAFAESRGAAALPPAALAQELGAALVATGQSRAGKQVLKESRRVLLLTYGEDDSRVKKFDASHSAINTASTE